MEITNTYLSYTQITMQIIYNTNLLVAHPHQQLGNFFLICSCFFYQGLQNILLGTSIMHHILFLSALDHTKQPKRYVHWTLLIFSIVVSWKCLLQWLGCAYLLWIHKKLHGRSYKSLVACQLFGSLISTHLAVILGSQASKIWCWKLLKIFLVTSHNVSQPRCLTSEATEHTCVHLRNVLIWFNMVQLISINYKKILGMMLSLKVVLWNITLRLNASDNSRHFHKFLTVWRRQHKIRLLCPT